jgi:hypothetical protein
MNTNNTLQLQTLSQVELGANYLKLNPGVTDHDLGQIFASLNTMAGASLFWIGDLMCHVESNKGEHYTKAFEDSGYEPQTLRNAKAVCKTFPPDVRAKLSFSHHAEAKNEAKNLEGDFDMDFALKHLNMAEQANLSVKQMRTLIRTEIKDLQEQSEPPVKTKDILNKDYIIARDAVFSLIRYLENIDSSKNAVAVTSIFGEIESLYELAVKVCKGGEVTIDV